MSSDVTTLQGVTLDDIKSRVGKYSIQASEEFPESTYPHISRSSVLVPLFFQNGDLHLLLTVRSASLRHHASTVSLPGGRKDETDVDEFATALRESEEEIGLASSQVETLGCLLPMCARPNYVIFPVVGLIPDDFRPEPNEQEVEFVFSVPLARFLQADFVSKETQAFGRTFSYQTFPCMTERGTVQVWGATAIICVLVACIIYKQEPPFNSVAMLTNIGGFEGLLNGIRQYYYVFCESSKPVAKL